MENVISPDVVELEANPDASQQQPVVAALSKNFPQENLRASREIGIILHVKQYLNENEDQEYFDIDDMVDGLRQRHKEYKDQNLGEFKILVERAYSEISIPLQQFDLDPDEGSSSKLVGCNAKDSLVSFKVSKPLSTSNTQRLKQPAQLKAMPKQFGNSVELVNLCSDGESPTKKTNIDNTKDLLCNIRASSGSTVTRRQKLKPRILLKRSKRRVTEKPPKLTFADFAGNSTIIDEVCKLIIHMKHPEVFERLGVQSPRGFLLHGPPGCGKTLLANAIAGELTVPIIKVSGPELVGGVSGESEERIQDLFMSAVRAAPCVLFIDEIDSITPNRWTTAGDMERRIVAQLLSSLDELSNVEHGHKVLVIGATNQLDSLDPALRRVGRFDREICLGIPDAKSREQILQHYSKNIKLSEVLDLKQIAQMTLGYVGADLVLLLREAAMHSIFRVLEEMQFEKERKRKLVKDSGNKEVEPLAKKVDVGDKNGVIYIEDDEEKNDGIDEVVVDDLAVNNDGSPFQNSLLDWLKCSRLLNPHQLYRFSLIPADITKALKKVEPSAKREGFVTVADVTWDDIGSLSAVRKHLEMEILGPLKYQAQFESLGLARSTGVLLYGPPGCGKTLLAKAVANETGINFISVKGPELLNMYVGESERAVRQVFQRARSSIPCVIFFDELDALCPRRLCGDSGATMRVVNQMLTEMDGIGDRKGVFLMAATNRPDIVDQALLRPGRLNKTVYVGIPSARDRADILRTITKNGTKPKIDSDVSLEAFASQKALENFTGADLAVLVREASMQALREAVSSSSLNTNLIVTHAHFEEALKNVRPSLSEQDRKRYDEMKKEFAEVPPP